MTDEYITISKAASKEIIINKSRFIGYASPCPTESDALLYIKKIREEHKTATHNCYAYIIGQNSGIIRYSDDGEPGGTAGLPILDVIRSRRIVNCCVVVTRYFGGVLLGTGGLVRAYTGSCQEALNAAGISVMKLTTDFYCALPYGAWDRFRYSSERLPVMIERIEYSSNISFHLLCCSKDTDTVLPKLLEASDRKLEIISHSESYMPWPEQ
jgi:uncharacterized YigZ family protein